MQARRSFWFQWVIANTVGWMIGWGVAFGAITVVSVAMFPELGTEIMPGDLYWAALLAIVSTIAGLAAGFVIGEAQSRILQREVQEMRNNRWRLASASGWALGSGVFIVGHWIANGVTLTNTAQATLSAIINVISIILVGTLPGIVQWFILRHRIQYAGLWAVINAVGVSTSIVIGFELITAFRDLCLGIILGGGILGLMFGTFTGTVLIWMLPFSVGRS